jgi:transcriptional regulator with XRE-family HTH domain
MDQIIMKTPAHNTPLGRLMTERGLSQSFLAREADVTQSFVNRVAKGSIESPRRSTMLKMAAYLEVPVDTIYPE